MVRDDLFINFLPTLTSVLFNFFFFFFFICFIYNFKIKILENTDQWKR